MTAAAAIMVGALAGLAFGRVAGLQELGVGLAAGVALDATLVRGVALPAALTLLGPAAWWRPGRGRSARERASAYLTTRIAKWIEGTW